MNTLKTIIVLHILASPSLLIAQDIKEMRSVVITQTDTVINGKNLKDTSPAEHLKLKKELDSFNAETKGVKTVTIEKRLNSDPKGEDHDVFLWKSEAPGRAYSLKHRGPGGPEIFNMKADSIFTAMKMDSIFTDLDFNFDFPDSSMRSQLYVKNFDSNNAPPVRPYRNRSLNGNIDLNRKNTQLFNFRNTDKDGITTVVNISVSDPAKQQWSQLTGKSASESTLEIANLTITPDFASGKFNLSFISDSKGSTSVKILDSDYKSIFNHTSTFTGNYFKQFSLPKNGIYYLVVKQGKDWYVKRFIKD